MSDFASFHQDALAEVLSFIGESLTYKGQTYTAVVNSIALEQELGDGGIAMASGALAVCRKSDFGSAPAIGEKVVYNGRTFRILKVEDDVSSFELTLATATK